MQASQASPNGIGKRLGWGKLLVVLIVASGVLLFIAANTHLVIVAIQSQSECMEHERVGIGGDDYSAAGSAC